MLLSMTGQGGARVLHDATRVAAELRTVNNRYYKLALRISDGYSSLEPRIDDLVRRFVHRGTVQLDVRIERESAADDYRLNEVALGSTSSRFSNCKIRCTWLAKSAWNHFLVCLASSKKIARAS